MSDYRDGSCISQLYLILSFAFLNSEKNVGNLSNAFSSSLRTTIIPNSQNCWRRKGNVWKMAMAGMLPTKTQF